MKIAGLMEENLELQQRIKELQSTEGDLCPRCRKRGWQIESSERDEVYGIVGGIRRTYKCSFCGFSEEELIKPK